MSLGMPAVVCGRDYARTTTAPHTICLSVVGVVIVVVVVHCGFCGHFHDMPMQN